MWPWAQLSPAHRLLELPVDMGRPDCSVGERVWNCPALTGNVKPAARSARAPSPLPALGSTVPAGAQAGVASPEPRPRSPQRTEAGVLPAPAAGSGPDRPCPAGLGGAGRGQAQPRPALRHRRTQGTCPRWKGMVFQRGNGISERSG